MSEITPETLRDDARKFRACAKLAHPSSAELHTRAADILDGLAALQENHPAHKDGDDLWYAWGSFLNTYHRCNTPKKDRARMHSSPAAALIALGKVRVEESSRG